MVTILYCKKVIIYHRLNIIDTSHHMETCLTVHAMPSNTGLDNMRWKDRIATTTEMPFYNLEIRTEGHKRR